LIEVHWINAKAMLEKATIYPGNLTKGHVQIFSNVNGRIRSITGPGIETPGLYGSCPSVGLGWVEPPAGPYKSMGASTEPNVVCPFPVGAVVAAFAALTTVVADFVGLKSKFSSQFPYA
jgi:hypothetical protein